MSAKLVKVCNSFSGIARGTVKTRVRIYHLSSLTRPSVTVTTGTLTSEYNRQPIVTEGKQKANHSCSLPLKTYSVPSSIVLKTT